jgi:uncharacterized lipoprotein YehR (DUF1307 family)
MKRVSILFVVIATIFMVSCTDSEREKMFNYGNEFKVEMYSGGQLVRSWISTGKVNSEEGSDGYYFKDKATGNLVEVSGDIVITNN